MKKRIFSVIIIILLIFLLEIVTYCGKNKVTNPNNPAEIELKDFPNKIGDEWKYFYYDSLSSYSDTVVVRIIGDTTFDDTRTAKIWEYLYRNKTEYRYVEVLDDTVRIFENLKSLWTNIKFVFPLKLNRGWKGDFATDTSSVIGEDSVSVKAGHFTECYLIEETWGAFNDYGRVYTWFVPGIGIVKKHHLSGSFVMANNYWELLEYKIEEP
ncbi:MAG: hypothetical protein GXO77_01925 [Calditrichaeota bacterium]|nr:hypothetical protein [Calditrichota bacterium]